MTNPKIVFFDIETSPNVAYTWRVGYNINLTPDNIVKERRIICICWKYAGQKTVHHLTWDKDHCDKKLLKEFGNVLREADVAIGHNGDKFDLKWVKTRNLIHKLPPLTNVTTMDTLKLARSNFNFNSNKLDYLCKILEIAPKLDVSYSLWTKVMDGDKTALNNMVTYCKQDVCSLEECFNVLRPYVDKMPVHLGVLIGQGRESCPSCGSTHLQRRGFTTTRAGRYQRLACMSCGHWHRSSKMHKEVKND